MADVNKNPQIAQGEFTEQELMAANVKNAERALNVMQDLDKIKTPIECTIYLAGQKSSYRNDAYRKMVSEMDLKTKYELKKFIDTNLPKVK